MIDVGDPIDGSPSLPYDASTTKKHGPAHTGTEGARVAAATSGQRTGRKRGNNEGNIRQRADGRWEARVTLRTGTSKSFYGKTRADVQRAMTQALRDVQRGVPVPTSRQTVAQFLRRWLEEVAKPSLRPSTYAGYKVVIEKHLVPHIGKLPLEKLTPQDVQALLAERSRAGLSPRTVQLIRAVLRRALGQAVEWDLVGRNAAVPAKPPRQHRYQARIWTPEETRRFLAAAQNDRWAALYTVAAYLGLRQGEALGLRWADIDVEARTLRVSGAMPTVGPRVRSEPKTERSRRTLPLPAAVVTALRTQRTRQLEERLRAGDAWQDHDLVFASIIGTPVERKGLHDRWKRAITQAGVPDIRFHDLRHGCASFLLASGVPARVVMDILGHSSIKTTMDTYSHVMPHLVGDAMTTLDAVLGTGTD